MDCFDQMKQMKLEPPMNMDELSALEQAVQFTLPEQYKEFLRLHNGGEGPVGKYGYIAIFGSQELLRSNGEETLNEYPPELFYFASDRGGMLYAFDRSIEQHPIVELPCDSIDQDDVETVAETFTDFIRYLDHIDDSEFDEGLS